MSLDATFSVNSLRLVAAGALLACGSAWAQPVAEVYPAKPIHLILPFPPGGGTDIIGRILSERMAAELGQPVVIENRGGAGGNVGAEAAARSAPDGYTIVLVAPSLAISPSLYKKLNYDALRDLTPIGLVATVPNVLVIHPAVPAQTLAEFIALAKTKPGGMNFGSGGSGTSNHLAGELFNLQAGVKLVHVPYKGVNLAMNDLIAGQVQLVVIGISPAAPFIKAGRLRALAVLTSQRSPALPDVPTAAEATGRPGYEFPAWFGFLAPAGTPPDIVNKLYEEIAKAMDSPQAKERMATLGAEIAVVPPQQFSAELRAESDKWGKLIKALDIKGE
jgi:tripartite-type tricarboxylate transporter receptor subunit TctC